MNTISDRDFKLINWSAVAMFTLGFWLSASLLLDAVIIPSLSASGMMAQGGFANAGFLLFGIFNRLELVCGALVLTSFLIFKRHHTLSPLQERWSIVLAGSLLAIALAYTYILTPEMSGLGLQLNQFAANNTMPPAMISLHERYWLLEGVKMLVGATLLRWCYRDSCHLA